MLKTYYTHKQTKRDFERYPMDDCLAVYPSYEICRNDLSWQNKQFQRFQVARLEMIENSETRPNSIIEVHRLQPLVWKGTFNEETYFIVSL